MGSFISITNNTNDIYSCQIGDDTVLLVIFDILVKALDVLKVIASVIPGLGAIIGAALLVIKVTIETAEIFIAAAAQSTGQFFEPTGVGLGNAFIFYTLAQLKSNGFTTLLPGASFESGKLTLSLLQQVHCFRFRVEQVEPTFVIVNQDELFGRPIFSGPTANSVNHYSLSQFDGNLAGPPMVFVIPFNTTAQNLTVRERQMKTSEIYWNYSQASMTSSQAATGATARDAAAKAPVCHVCGADYKLQNPSATVTIPGEGTHTCSALVTAGLNGDISAEDCPLVEQYMVGPCGCSPFVCHIWGLGTHAVANKDVVVPLPAGNPKSTCGAINSLRSNGKIAKAVCPWMVGYMSNYTADCGLGCPVN